MNVAPTTTIMEVVLFMEEGEVEETKKEDDQVTEIIIQMLPTVKVKFSFVSLNAIFAINLVI